MSVKLMQRLPNGKCTFKFMHQHQVFFFAFYAPKKFFLICITFARNSLTGSDWICNK